MEHTKEQEHVHTAQKYIISFSDLSSSLSSDYSLETLPDDSSDSGTRKKPTEPVLSSIFQAKRKSNNE